MDGCHVITLEFAAACEGRPKTLCRRAASGLQECQTVCRGMGISRVAMNRRGS
jgi:hypothetical protein